MNRMNFPVLFVTFLYFQFFNIEIAEAQSQRQASHYVKKINYNGVNVDLVIDDPGNDTTNVILVYHGTVSFDSKILQATEIAVDKIKTITDPKNILIIGVAYPEEGLLMGDNVKESEAALLWVKNRAKEELNVIIQKIFLVGHSQGGYIVTRLNTMHETDGVVASAPGPLNMGLRCRLEEAGKAPPSEVCSLLKKTYGPAQDNPKPYHERSLLNFTTNYKSDILFIQGLQDSRIQMTSWPVFKEKVSSCTSCKKTEFLNLDGYGHNALFQSKEAMKVYNEFINR